MTESDILGPVILGADYSTERLLVVFGSYINDSGGKFRQFVCLALLVEMQAFLQPFPSNTVVDR